MPTELQQLIKTSKFRDFPADERDAQRRSFAYGNARIENPRINLGTVDQQADALRAQARHRVESRRNRLVVDIVREALEAHPGIQAQLKTDSE